MKSQALKFRIVSVFLILVFLLGVMGVSAQDQQTQAVADYPADVAISWFDLQLRLVRETPGYTPPVASRAFGYTGVTLYEALVGGMPANQSLVGQLNELTELPQADPEAVYAWDAVANSALAQITRLLFPTPTEANLTAVDELYESLVADYVTADAAVIERSEAFGVELADAVYAWAMTDGGHNGQATNFPQDYVAPEGEGMWVPTPRTSGNGDPLPALQPYWGNNRTFVVNANEACMPVAPPEYSEEPTSQFYAETLEVYEVSQELSEEEITIARFWSDDPGQTATPPGHSISILSQILSQEDASLAFAAEAYARMGIAVADAFIGCWNAKYVYGLLRPVTIIQALMDENWLPILDTPPFPEYPSGHSVQSGAAQIVLEGLFGEEYSFTDSTHVSLGLEPRSFSSFSEMAQEAAMSRLYGGIHYRAAIELGIDQGHCIGEQVNALVFRAEA